MKAKFTHAALVAALASASFAAHAITPAGTPPTFFCDVNRPVDADTVEAQLNTRAVNATDRLNQPRWEYATPPSPGVTAGPDPLPAPAGGWVYFTGTELSGYVGGLNSSNSLARIGFYPVLPGTVANTMRYFRYRFVLDATVDPATYVLSVPSVLIDDEVRGTYLNGALVSPGLANSIGGGATANLQWRTGLNELTFAVFDGANPAATSLGVTVASQAVCNYRAAPVVAVPTASTTTLVVMGGMLALLAGRRRRRA